MKSEFFTVTDEEGRTAGIIKASTSRELERMLMDCTIAHHCADDASIQTSIDIDYIKLNPRAETVTVECMLDDEPSLYYDMRLKHTELYEEVKDTQELETKFFLIDGYWIDDKAPIEGLILSVDVCEVDAEDMTDQTETNGLQDQDIFYYGINESEIKEIIKDGEFNDKVDFVITSYKPYFPNLNS